MSENYTTLKNSKYIYKVNENEEEMFVFEIVLKKFVEKNEIIRKIKKTRNGKLLKFDENIKYEDINKILLNIINVNDPTKEINVCIKLDHLNKYSTFINNNIYLEFFKNLNLLECNYRILND